VDEALDDLVQESSRTGLALDAPDLHKRKALDTSGRVLDDLPKVCPETGRL